VAGYSEHVEKDHIFSTHWNMEHTFAGQVDATFLLVFVLFISNVWCSPVHRSQFLCLLFFSFFPVFSEF